MVESLITLICGVGRAGKSTYATAFVNVIHLDLMGHIPERYANVNRLVENMENVTVEGVYNLKKYRSDLLKAYKWNNRKCIWLDTPVETVTARMDKEHIPISTVHFYFEPPTLEEGWDEIIIIRGDHEQRINRPK